MPDISNPYSGVVVENGSRTVNAGETYLDTIVNSGGSFLVTSGGSADDTTVNGGGAVHVSNGGTVYDTIVNPGGVLVTSEGGRALETKENGGYVEMGNNTRVTFLPNAFSGMVLNGSATVHSGTTATDITVMSGGRLLVSAGGQAMQVKENGGYVDVGLSAYATFAPNTVSGLTLNDSATIHSGTTFRDLTVNADGKIFVYEGGKVTGKITFETGADIKYFVSGILDFDLTQTTAGADALVNDLSAIIGSPLYTLTVDGTEADGTYSLADGATGFKDVITVKKTSGDELGTISVGGADLECGGKKYTLALSGAVLTVTIGEGGGSGGTITGDVTGETKDITSGWSALDVNVNEAGILNVYSAGEASDTTVNTYGKFSVFGGGTASGATVNDGGTVDVPGGTVSDIVIHSGGIAEILSGGVANNVTVDFLGYLGIGSDCTATDIVENGGIVTVLSGAAVTFKPNSFSGLVLDGMWATVHSGTTATETTVNDGGSFNIFDGGMVNGVTVNQGGEVNVSGGTVNDAVVTGASLRVNSGGVLNGVTANSGAYVGISAGAAATAVVENGGYVFFKDTVEPVVFKPNSFSGLVLDGKGDGEKHRATVHSGTTATDTTVNVSGLLQVFDGGVADGVAVDSTGQVEVFGGVVNNASVKYGWLIVSSGGTATNANAHYGANGGVFVVSGGVLKGAAAHSGGYIAISAGAAATEIMENGGYVSIADGVDPEKITFRQNTFSGVALDGTMASVHSGTTAIDTTVNKDGFLRVAAGGVADGVAVKAGGEFVIMDGARLTGQMTFEKDAVVTMEGTANLDFDLTRTTAGASPLVNDLSFIVDQPYTYTLTVDDRQSGTYSLAGNAAGFDKTITVVNTSGAELAALTLDDPIEIGGIGYTLNLEDGLLSVTVDVYDGYEGNHSMETAAFVDIKESPGGTITNLTVHDPGVDDYYKIVLPDTGLDGDYIVLRFANDVDFDLYLLDADGNTVVKSTGTENVEGVSVRDLPAGDYYIRITAPFTSLGDYKLTWNFTFNDVKPDALESLEPYAITGSTELADLTICPSDADGVTQEDTFKLTLTQDGNADSKIRFSNYRNDWNGLKYVLKDGTGGTVRDGTGAEISLNGLAAGEYTLVVDTPVEGSYGKYALSASLPEAAAKKWTYMVYFASDNNLGTWSMYDVIQMQQAVLNPGIDIYVLFDRPSKRRDKGDYVTVNGTYRMDSDWHGTKVGKISYDPGLTVSVDWDETWGGDELDTGSVETLQRFVNWVKTQSDADNFGLIMWDHGSADGTLCIDETPDENPGMTTLDISDVANVLKNEQTKEDGIDVPIVIFNNCLLGSDIVVSQMTGATDVIVVSEPVSFVASTFSYKEFFDTITVDMTPQEMAQLMVRNVRHQPEGAAAYKPTMLSAVDVSDSRLPDALEALADAVFAARNDTDKAVLVNAMKKAPQDGCLYSSNGAEQSDLYDLILQAMADRDYENTSEGFRNALANLNQTFEAVVLEFRSIPSNRGYGIAFDNVIYSAMEFIAEGASAKKTAELTKKYLDTYYTATPGWAGLLYEVCRTYLAQNRGTLFHAATFNVSDNSDLVEGKTVSVSDLGCFSGQGAVFDGISLVGDYFFQFVITDEDHSTGGFRVANDLGAPVVVSVLSGDGSVVRSGTDSVSFENIAAGDYYLRLQSETDCDVTLSFEAAWATGADRFDYAVTGINDGKVDGNGIVEKETSISEGYYPGLLTSLGDLDFYRIGDNHSNTYKVAVESTDALDIVVYDERMDVVDRPDGKDNLYSMRINLGQHLSITVKGDTDKIVCYSIDITSLEASEKEKIVIDNPVGTSDGVSWESSAASAVYTVEFSQDNFANVFQVSTNGKSVDTPELPAGTYQWRVRPEEDYPFVPYDWTVGSEIVSKHDPTAPKAVRSDSDGDNDIFFATPNGTWGRNYYAKHVGSVGDDWGGTNETVSARGKGRIQNLYFGSADPNVMCLTDKENGDAIFLDDIYTERPEEIEEDMARLSKIETILAGAGDDIVDMTSRQFAYVGGDMVIRGGDGDDVIWANKGSNQLFGDAGNDCIVGASGKDLIVGGSGNDSMHGGGGDDIFTFCDNWGTDTVEQTADGKVTLWFMEGDFDHWNSETLTYTEGENSVTVSGVSADQIELVFAFYDTASYAVFDKLFQAGAFDPYSSRTVFDVEPAGYLANA